MKKPFKVFDLYEMVTVAKCDTLEEAEKELDEFGESCDWECDLQILMLLENGTYVGL